MATTEQIRANINANRERDMRQQMQAMNYETEEIAPGIPANGSNDAALANHLKQMRDSNAEYAKLRTEEARQQWEAIATDNFRRDQANQNRIKTQAAVETMNRAASDRAEGQRLFSELQAVTQDIPAEVLNREGEEWRIPLDKLKDIATVTQKIANLNATQPKQQTQAQPQQARPETFPDGSLYQLTNLPDGNLEVKLITGEVFRGDPISVTRTIAESKVHTRRWAQQQIAQAQQRYEQQPAQQQPTEQQIQNTNFSGSLADDLQQRQREQIAQTLGYSNAQEMYQEVNDLREFKNQMKTDLALQRFITAYPEFPGTENPDDPVNQAIGSIFEEKGWQDVSFENLEAAHALAIQRGYYQPLRPGTYVQQNNRPTPPPMLRTNNPEVTMQTPDPYNMNLNLAELRKLAVAQQLGGETQRR